MSSDPFLVVYGLAIAGDNGELACAARVWRRRSVSVIEHGVYLTRDDL